MALKFEAKQITVGNKVIVKIPIFISEKLPSRGMVMVQCEGKGASFEIPLEPDGKGSHFFEVDTDMAQMFEQKNDENTTLRIEPLLNWREPEMPLDIIEAFDKAGVIERWMKVTPKAKWEWLRWIRATKNVETRRDRIEVACSKLSKGDKRPCCFDVTRCTLTEVSKSGVLLA